MDRIPKIEAGSSIRSQIVAFYRNRIRSGELAAGAVLPPARLLAAQLGTAEANVHHAFAALVREGLIARRPRAGTVVIGEVKHMDKNTVEIVFSAQFAGKAFLN